MTAVVTSPYIDDIVEGVVRVMRKAPERRQGDDGLPVAPYALYNIGNSHPENLLDFVRILEEESFVGAGVLPEDYDFDAHKELVPMQPGDVPVTYADTSALERDFGFRPSTPFMKVSAASPDGTGDFYGIDLKTIMRIPDNGSRSRNRRSGTGCIKLGQWSVTKRTRSFHKNGYMFSQTKLSD